MVTRASRLTFAAAVAAVLIWRAWPAPAGDHLACYKVKDQLAKAQFSGVSLLSNTGGPNQNGCTIATGAKLCCDAVDKMGVPPQPGGAGPGASTTRFCCYKVKCQKGPSGNLDFTDQFGSRALPVTTPKMICAPVPGTPSIPECANEGGGCGSCGDGICVSHCGGPGQLVCVSNHTYGQGACTADAACITPGNLCGATSPANCGTGNLNGCFAPCP